MPFLPHAAGAAEVAAAGRQRSFQHDQEYSDAHDPQPADNSRDPLGAVSLDREHSGSGGSKSGQRSPDDAVSDNEAPVFSIADDEDE